ncbi:MAG: 4-alpha-glucanotransferase [Sarcina sp.]
MRKSGIILPIFSLPSNYGIGSFGEEAYKFVDFLKEGGQSLWQILPMGPTGYGDSPYQSFSTFAGNPYFIDLDILVKEGLLENKDIKNISFADNESLIDYETLYEKRYKILKIAFENKSIEFLKKIEDFKILNKDWIDDYAMFMAIKDFNNGAPWNTWGREIKFRTNDGILKYKKLLNKEIDFYIFIQYLFFSQWESLKSYAGKNGIEFIGDIPIYVALDSADVWANQELFMLDKNLNPIEVAGCPPDSFSEDGQLWGNPLYDWSKMEQENYRWWIRRFKESQKLFDIIRLDHFRGFESYWTIPFDDKNAINGKWKKGPGIKLFEVVKKEIENIEIIAEDLGYITTEVRELLNSCNFKGMKVLQFAFGSGYDNEYLPHKHIKNSIVYTGTHDNKTLKTWCKELEAYEKNICLEYIGKDGVDSFDIVRLAFASVADICMIQMQDILDIGSEGRINLPASLGNNWRWRMKKDSLSQEIIDKLKKLSVVYERN